MPQTFVCCGSVLLVKPLSDAQKSSENVFLRTDILAQECSDFQKTQIISFQKRDTLEIPDFALCILSIRFQGNVKVSNCI